ncbi:MAG: hypothetical protein HY314_02620 [Acidobacteria bacterium]|nr:hypothetical protein [Acidobacteriota bacterium]
MPKTSDLQEQAVALIERLPKEKLRTVVDFLFYLQDHEAWEATWELTSDPKVMASLRRSEEHIRKGRVKRWKDVRRDV